MPPLSSRTLAHSSVESRNRSQIQASNAIQRSTLRPMTCCTGSRCYTSLHYQHDLSRGRQAAALRCRPDPSEGLARVTAQGNGNEEQPSDVVGAGRDDGHCRHRPRRGNPGGSRRLRAAGRKTGAGPITVVFESGFGQGAGPGRRWLPVWGATTTASPTPVRDSASPAATVTPAHRCASGRPHGRDRYAPPVAACWWVIPMAACWPRSLHAAIRACRAWCWRTRPRWGSAMRSSRPTVPACRQMMPSCGRCCASHGRRLRRADRTAGCTRCGNPRTMPDVPVALLTATQLAAEPLFFEETAAGKALWKAQHALLSRASRAARTATGNRPTLQREVPAAVVAAIQSVSGTSK